ncbi:OLC1v1004685C1 [Oldenlandia corymbosa var. corymbosa]|nr:OLC1v1004685C1 [Oldenlandia corymbosa var. corymbosa]
MDQLQGGSHRSRASNGSQKLLPSSDCNFPGFASFHNAGFVEVDQSHGCTPRGNKVKHRLKELRGALTTSKELLKVLNNISRLEEQPPTSLSLVSALKIEIDRACVQVNKLIHEHKSNQHEIDFLLQQFEEEKAAWKVREKERIRGAISSIAGELEIERKLKGQSERLNKKLGKELADKKASLSKATKELEREKKAREILEQVCDELAQGIGEDRAIVAELTRESAKVREEVEKEREMLHLADVLREERVQMKLLEAKYQFEEKNAVVDELKNELEAYLKSKVDRGEQENGSPNYERIKELEKYLRETLPVPTHHYHDQEKNAGEIVFKENQGEAEDSPDSDLHSIELNMDDHSKSFRWNDVYQVETNKTAMNGKIKGRKSTSSEKRQRKSISIERQTSDGIEWEFSPAARQLPSDVYTGSSKVFDFPSKDWKRECEDEIERYNMIKNLRDNIVSGSKIASFHEASSPKGNWDQHNSASQDLSKVVREAFGVLQEAI